MTANRNAAVTSDHPQGEREPIGELDLVIHAPARLAIVTMLHVAGGADFVFLQKQTGLTRGNLSSHLGKLEAAGYISVEKAFVDRVPRTLMTLTDAGREAFAQYRRQMRKRLDHLPD
jgi:DNA-binding MarR family transcriptional regulator